MRRRLAVAIAGVAAAAVLLFALPLALSIQSNHRTQGLLRLQRDTVAAARAIDLTAGGRDPIELPSSSDRLAVYDVCGRRVAGRGPDRADALVRSALRGRRPADRLGDGRLEVAVPLLTGERVTGAVRAHRSDDGVAAEVRNAWLALLGAAIAVIAVAIAAALLLGRRLAAPLERLAAAARRLGDGDFSVRAPRSAVEEVDAVGRALDATSARLEELIARERRFSADASHQLRTPLAALRVELEALELRAGGSAELAAALTQVERLQTTIATLLSVARDAPRPVASTDLVALLDALGQRWRARLAAEGRPLRVAIDSPTPLASASPPVIEEILEVLLDNAHRHGDGAVSLTIRDTGSSVALDVADDGPGLGDPESTFARRSGAPDGHGIGLALARSLAAAEGGKLSASHTPAGARFTLTLRRQAAPPSP